VSGGELGVFISRPGAAILLTLNIALVASQLPFIRRGFARKRRKTA
jgi:putative tricarboxylic transport membrane protein